DVAGLGLDDGERRERAAGGGDLLGDEPGALGLGGLLRLVASLLAEEGLDAGALLGLHVVLHDDPLLGHLGGALEKAAVEVEDVARVRLAARRAAEEERELTISDGLLGEVVVHDE